MNLTYEELDDLDSAIADSITLIEDDWRGSNAAPVEVKAYAFRLGLLRGKISNRMWELRPNATISATTPEVKDEA